MFSKIDCDFISNLKVVLTAFGNDKAVEQIEDNALSLTLFENYTLDKVDEGWLVRENGASFTVQTKEDGEVKKDTVVPKSTEVYKGASLADALQATIKHYALEQLTSKMDTMFSNTFMAEWLKKQE